MRRLLSLTILAFSLVACSSDDERAYPSVVTEMVVMRSDDSGTIRSFVTDAQKSYVLVKPYTGVKANAAWRMLLGYALEENGEASVYAMEPVVVLRDSTTSEDLRRDPIGFVSCWRSGRYVNLHLRPKTQGGVHYWAYARESATNNGGGGTTYSLLLHHRQGDDPTAYSTDAYLSIPVDSVSKEISNSDSIIITMTTFDGQRSYRLGLSH